MRRFDIKSVLIMTAVVAIWLATFSAPDPGLQGPGVHIRKAMLLIIFVAAGMAAACNRGRSRAFWAAFFVTMLLLVVDVLSGYYRPDCNSIAGNWTNHLTRAFGLSSYVQTFVFCSIRDGFVIVIATVAGVFAVWVYDQSRTSEEA
jgi:hypothetical protein